MTPSDPPAGALAALLAAPHPPRPWQDGRQLPWDDDAFSERMLRLHLDPSTDMASRRPEMIRAHVDWLCSLLAGRGRQAASVLDVGCGPGLYCAELARRGHRAAGFDYAPAPLRHAREQAAAESLDCRYRAADLTDLPDDLCSSLGGPFDAVTFWYGEFHSFPRAEAAAFLPRLASCLAPGGLFVLEYQPWDLFVRENSTTWQTVPESPFCDRPHLWLQEFAWDEEAEAEIHVHWILEAASGNLHRYAQCHAAWREAELVAALARAGLVEPAFHPPVTGLDESVEFPLLVTRKQAGP